MAQVTLSNRTYYLCIEDIYAATVIGEWIYHYKEVPLYFRDAGKGVVGSFVVVIKDREGKDLSFIECLAKITRAKIEIR